MATPIVAFALILAPASLAAERIEVRAVGVDRLEPGATHGIKIGGVLYKRLVRTIHFIASDHGELSRIDISDSSLDVSPDSEFPTGRTIQRSFNYRVPKNGQFVGVLERVHSRATTGDIEGFEISTSTFRYYNAAGRLLWSKEIFTSDTQGNEFAVSADGERVALIVTTPLTRRERQMSEFISVKQTHVLIYDRNGREITTYKPAAGHELASVGISNGGRYIVANGICVELESGLVYHPIGPGFTTVDDNGVCKSNRLIPEFDRDGEQLTETTDEHKFR